MRSTQGGGRAGIEQEAGRALGEDGGGEEGRQTVNLSVFQILRLPTGDSEAHAGCDLCKSQKVGTLKPSLISFQVQVSVHRKHSAHSLGDPGGFHQQSLECETFL